MKLLAILLVAAALLASLWFLQAGAADTTILQDEAAADPVVVEVLQPVVGGGAVDAVADRSGLQPAENVPIVAEPAPVTEIQEGDLRVYVVDEAGEPLGGVPLATFGVVKTSRRPSLRAVTAEGSGLAIFVGAADALDECARLRPASRFQVGLDVPGVDLQRVDLDLAAWPDEALHLTVPSSGTLTVRMTDSQGAPITDQIWIHVTPLIERRSQPGYFDRGERHSVWAKEVSEVIVPYVTAGNKLRLSVRGYGLFAGAQRDIEALDPGEQRTETLVVDGPLPYFVGRVVLPSGEPVEATYLNIKSGPVSRQRVELAPDGSFRLVFTNQRSSSDTRAAVRLLIRPRGADGTYGTGATLTGEFDAAVPLPGAPVDVGDVVMKEAPVFASGTVVDDAGKPIEGASISIYTKFNQRADPEDFGWNSAGVPYHHTDSGGRFQVAADLPAGEYAIRATAKGYVVRSAVRFLSGQRDIVLQVSPQRFLSGRLLLPNGVDTEQCKVVATVPGATREEKTYISFYSGVAGNGKFAIAGMRAPAVQLALQYGQDKVQLAALDGVLPRTSAVEIPEELNPWDVRKDLRRIAFDVRLFDGTPASTGLVAYGSQSFVIEGGRVEALAKAEEDDEVFVVAPGHLPTILNVGTLPEEVELLRGIPVRVAIESALPALPDGVRVSVSLRRKDRDWLPWTGDEWSERDKLRLPRSLWTEEVAVQPSETEWELHVPAVGSYQPVWTVHQPGNRNLRTRARTRSFGPLRSDYGIDIRSTARTARRWEFRLHPSQMKRAFGAGN
jgi:protocatechuate 3,4-dioxygenase beta subunit